MNDGSQYLAAAYGVVLAALILYVVVSGLRSARLAREAEVLARIVARDGDRGDERPATTAASAGRGATRVNGHGAVPAIASVRERAEEIRREAVEAARWERLTPADRRRVEELTRAIVARLLHEPTVRAGAGGPDGLADGLRHLFGLGVTRT